MGARVTVVMGGPLSLLLVLVMLAGCLALWVGVPLGWLWIGSQVQGSSSLGTALLVTMAGIVVSIAVMVTILGWLNRQHAELQRRRNRPAGVSALEVLLVISAGLAVVGFGLWFFFFAGSSPIPISIGA